MKRNKHALTTQALKSCAALSLGCFLLTACPKEPGPTPYPTPIETPPASPTPTPVPTGTPLPTPNPTLGDLNVVELANGNLVSDSFKLDFGPGSKGVKLEFGPGSKGAKTEFGPGTKGPKNIEFNISLPASLTNPNLAPFSVAQLGIGGGAFLNQLKVEFIRANQLYATASILPRRESLEVEAKFHPGIYSVQVVAQTANGPLTMSYSRFEVLPDYKAAFKVEVFSDKANAVKPEDLDVEILSQSRQEKIDLDAYPTISESPSPAPSAGLTAPIPTPSPIDTPQPSATPSA